MSLPVPALAIRPSRWLPGLVLLLYGCAFFISLHLPWPAPARLLLAAVLLADGWWRWRLLRRAWGVCALRVTAAHQLQVLYRDGQWQDVQLRAPCHVLPGLAILRGQVDGRPVSWLLEPGMLPAGYWRVLRVWLLWRLPELLLTPPWWRRLWQGLRRR